MDWVRDKAQIETRPDGTYVVMANIDGERLPYHVTPNYSPELYEEVRAFLTEEE